ncbi:MAG TPA: hypothetical protein VI758_06205 [Bacteroidota bacterium]
MLFLIQSWQEWRGKLQSDELVVRMNVILVLSGSQNNYEDTSSTRTYATPEDLQTAYSATEDN